MTLLGGPIKLGLGIAARIPDRRQVRIFRLEKRIRAVLARVVDLALCLRERGGEFIGAPTAGGRAARKAVAPGHEIVVGAVECGRDQGAGVDPRTIAADKLHEFVDNLGLPVLGYVRHTQNYIHLAAQGLTLWDVAPSRVERDLEQWQPLVAWIQR